MKTKQKKSRVRNASTPATRKAITPKELPAAEAQQEAVTDRKKNPIHVGDYIWDTSNDVGGTVVYIDAPGGGVAYRFYEYEEEGYSGAVLGSQFARAVVVIDTPQRTAGDAIAESDAAVHLWSEVDALGELVAKNLPAADPLAKLFRDAVERQDDEAPPDQAKLRAAWDAFHAQPLDRQREILNGWEPVTKTRPTREEVLCCCGVDVCRRLAMAMVKQGDPIICHTFEVDDMLYSARILIPEGTTKPEALKALRAAVKQVERGWDSMIRMTPRMAGKGAERV